MEVHRLRIAAFLFCPMPQLNAASLPEHVKKLPGEKRRQWVAIFTRVAAEPGRTEADALAKADSIVLGKKAAEIGNTEEDSMSNTATKEAADPGQAAVHTPAPIGGDKPAAKKKGKNPHFMSKLVAQMCDKFTDEEMSEMVKTARAHAGGMSKAEAAKMKAAMGADFDEPDESEDNAEASETDTEEPKERQMAEKAKDDADTEEAGESLTQKLREIESAFREWAKIPNLKANQWPDRNYWCREVFDGYVIAEGASDGELYKVTYTANSRGSYSFGIAQKVVTKYVVAMSEVGDLCADGNGWRLFVEHNFKDYAEPPEWMPLLPKPGSYQHPQYKEIKLTKERNKKFAKGVNAKVYQSSLPINTEHAPSNEGAYGWIEEARVNDDGSVDAKVKWSDLGEDAIKKDRFRFISPEWADEWEDALGKKHKDVIRGAALTVRPYFKDKQLRPLVASERGWYTPDANEKPSQDGANQYFFFTALEPTAPASQPETETLIHKEPKPMADKKTEENEEKKVVETPVPPVVKAAEPPSVDAQEFAEVKSQLATVLAENAANKQAAEAQAAQVKTLSEDNAKLKDDAETARFTEEVEGKSKDSQNAYVGDHAKHVKTLKSQAKAFGEDSDEFKFYVETARQTAAQAKESMLFREVGRSGVGDSETSAWGKANALAKQVREKNPELTEQQALAKVFAEPANKPLYQAYLAESN